MVFLKRNSVSCFLLLILTGCASSFYRVTNTDLRRNEISVSPDRILLECEDASENRDIPFGFTMHVLDNENTIVDVTQMNTLSRESCQDRLVEIGHILKTGHRIYIAGIGDLGEPKRYETSSYNFRGRGTFHSNGRVLQFMAIANENGLCYSAYREDEKPCPDGKDFPIRDKR